MATTASMRPRQSRLGIPQCPVAAAVAPSFNEAEAITPRNQRSLRPEPDDGATASMRPRQSRLGIGDLPGGDDFVCGVASMRPRQSRLGIAKLKEQEKAAKLLQ